MRSTPPRAATRFAVDAYVNFVKTRSVLEAVASSLTELFAPKTSPPAVKSACITVCSQTGMLSSGVLPPERRFIGNTTNMKISANCGMEREIVPRKMPKLPAKKR